MLKIPASAGVPRPMPRATPAPEGRPGSRIPGRPGSTPRPSPPPSLPRAAPHPSDDGLSVVLTLAQISIAELRADVARLFASGWSGPEQARIQELSAALAGASRRHGLGELAQAAQAVHSLAGLSRPEAIPLAFELGRKFKELLRRAEGVLARHARSTA